MCWLRFLSFRFSQVKMGKVVFPALTSNPALCSESAGIGQTDEVPFQALV